MSDESRPEPAVGAPKRKGKAARRAARERLGAVSEEAAGRRERLVRQLAMADEFIGLLAARRDG